jgi:hypothetical protein
MKQSRPFTRQQGVVTCDSVSKPSLKKMGAGLRKIADIPGVLAYGTTEDEAKANAYAIAIDNACQDT